MNPMDEADHLISKAVSQRPRSFQWQVFQSSLYLIGSCCFTIGSCMYFTKIYQTHPIVLTIGGWLFTLGSTIFIFADLQDWWDYRTGYCFDWRSSLRKDISLQSMNRTVSSNETVDLTMELNVFGSIIGIAFYFVGSIFFLPIFENFLVIGEWFFIFGSTFCSISLLWKLYQLARQNQEQKFSFQTLFQSNIVFFMDVCSLIGNLGFFIGTILFLPYINTNDSIQNRAASFFVFGSGCFLLSSIVLQSTLCCSNRS